MGGRITTFYWHFVMKLYVQYIGIYMYIIP